MKKINNIEQALKDVKKRQVGAEQTKKEAEETIKTAEEEIKTAEEEIKQIEDTEKKLLEAKQKQEEAEQAYNDALNAGGYEKKSTKNKNSFVKGLVIGATAVALIVGGYKLLKETKIGNIKSDDLDNKNNTQSTAKTQPTETQKVEDPMNAKKLEDLTANFTKSLKDKNINVNSEDVLKLVTIINIDRMSEECPELVTEIIGTQTKEEFMSGAFRVIGTIMDYNRIVYEKEGKTDNIIRLSNAVYGESNIEHLKFFEAYVDQISAAKNKPEEQERLVAEFIVALYEPTRKLENVKDGIGLASIVAVDAMANHVTFVNGTCQISDELRGKLINYTTAELYISNIFFKMNKCYEGNETLYYTPQNEVKTYSRNISF